MKLLPVYKYSTRNSTFALYERNTKRCKFKKYETAWEAKETVHDQYSTRNII
jgi:hypothetical protein